MLGITNDLLILILLIHQVVILNAGIWLVATRAVTPFWLAAHKLTVLIGSQAVANGHPPGGTKLALVFFVVVVVCFVVFVGGGQLGDKRAHSKCFALKGLRTP